MLHVFYDSNHIIEYEEEEFWCSAAVKVTIKLSFIEPEKSAIWLAFPAPTSC